MTTEEQNQKIIQSLANATFQSLNINGLIHAAKFYCIKEAEKKFEELDDETKGKIIAEIEAQEKAQAEAVQSEQTQESV